MSSMQERVEALLEATQNWLHEDNHYLADAMSRTVREGFFSYQDVQYAVDALKKGITKDVLEKWVTRVDQDSNISGKRQNVLCLHAGNLPLVGFQDAFSTLLSGARYTGKISRKDPYLLPTFLNEVKQTGLWSDMDVQWTHRLGDFEGMPHDAIIFAGSESSVPGVKQEIKKLDLAKDDARYLIRTANFSMAYLNQNDESKLEQLVEGVLRYGGKGCRSIAVVVAPFSLDEVQNKIKEVAKSFWLENPQHNSPTPKLRQQFAYNEAVQRSQLWLDYFLFQEGGLEFDQDFVCSWIEGDEADMGELAEQYESQLQSIYVSDSNTTIPKWKDRTELLDKVQQPIISWKPDGIDTLEWLLQ